jgi:hypothetical protein
MEKKMKITIHKDGNYSMVALEGFAGESCLEKTRDVELLLGGAEANSGKTSSYYDPDDSNPVSIALNE